MFTQLGWVPAFWLDIFDELLYDDNELDYGDEWNLNFNYTQTDEITKVQRKRGWKVYSHCAFGKYVFCFTGSIILLRRGQKLCKLLI